MKSNKLKIIIILLAAIIVSVFNIIKAYSLEKFSYTLLIVVIIFYIIGSIVQKVVNNIVAKSTSSEEDIKEESTQNEDLVNKVVQIDSDVEDQDIE